MSSQSTFDATTSSSINDISSSSSLPSDSSSFTQSFSSSSSSDTLSFTSSSISESVPTTPTPTSSASVSDTPTTTPTSSASPTSTPEPTTTPTSAPIATQPTSTSADQLPTTPAGGNTSTPPVASSSPVTSVSRSSSTVVQTAVVTSNGVIVTTIYTTTTAISVAPTTSSSTNASSSHTGAIVGGVVGGLAALGLIGLIVFCLLRRRHEDDFDGNFDPDRVVGHSSGGGTLPHIDLGAEVTPYTYPPHHDVSQPAMVQYNYGESPYSAMRPTSPPHSMPSQYPRPPSDYNQTFGPGSASDTSGSHYGPPLGPYGLPAGAAVANPWSPGARSPSPTNTSSSGPSQPHSAKEREALAARYGRPGGLGLSTQHEEPGHDEVRAGAGSSAGEGVVVHQDGGRVRDEDEGPTEIPPTYDSIPADERAH